MDRLLSMKIFCRVVECESLVKAARDLQMAPSTVTSHISQLEADLRETLLNRSTRHLSVTEQGQVVYERMSQILESIQSMDDMFAGVGKVPKGRLRVDVPPVLAWDCVIPALPAFRAQYPDVYLDLRINTQVVDLVEQGVDCAIRMGHLPDSRLIYRPLGSTRLVTCASGPYLDLNGTPETPDDLRSHQCITTIASTTGRPREWIFERDGRKVSLNLVGEICFNTMEGSARAAAMGLGITQVSRLIASTPSVREQLKPVLIDWIGQDHPIQVVYPRAAALSSKVRVFIDFMVEVIPRYLESLRI